MTKAERERENIREARRQAELTRMRNRVGYIATYRDIYDGAGNRVAAFYLGHVKVEDRGIQHKPTGFATLMSSVSSLDLTGASDAQQKQWVG